MTINQLAMRFGGLFCPWIGVIYDGDDNANNRECNKIDEGGNDNKKWRTMIRWWKCGGERGEDADTTIKLRWGGRTKSQLFVGGMNNGGRRWCEAQ
jgi:hypothetical protein